jgi:hypothetical protein
MATKKKFNRHTIGNKLLLIIKLVVVESILSLIMWGKKIFDGRMIGNEFFLLATSLATKNFWLS